jgi:hypothetical protein
MTYTLKDYLIKYAGATERAIARGIIKGYDDIYPELRQVTGRLARKSAVPVTTHVPVTRETAQEARYLARKVTPLPAEAQAARDAYDIRRADALTNAVNAGKLPEHQRTVITRKPDTQNLTRFTEDTAYQGYPGEDVFTGEVNVSPHTSNRFNTYAALRHELGEARQGERATRITPYSEDTNQIRRVAAPTPLQPATLPDAAYMRSIGRKNPTMQELILEKDPRVHHAYSTLSHAGHIDVEPVIQEQLGAWGNPVSMEQFSNLRDWGHAEDATLAEVMRSVGATPYTPIPVGGRQHAAARKLLVNRLNKQRGRTVHEAFKTQPERVGNILDYFNETRSDATIPQTVREELAALKQNPDYNLTHIYSEENPVYKQAPALKGYLNLFNK